MNEEILNNIRQIIDSAQKIVIVQADNPDGDSLGSALALEAILQEAGKTTTLYCGVDMPDYLKYLEGWSRIMKELPANFDASIIVDASTKTLFERSVETGAYNRLATKPSIILDHHEQTQNDISFATAILNVPISSTCELIYDLSKTLGLDVPTDALVYIATGILGDTQGLSNQLATAETYRVMAELITLGVDRPALEESRRQFSKMPSKIFKYKACLIERTEFGAEGRIAHVTVNQDEITTFSPLYNPGPLIQADMLQVQNVQVGIVFKVYSDGKITGMIRCNAQAEIASQIAVHFGGGGHGFAAGFKITDGRSFAEIMTECIAVTTDLLDTLERKIS